MSGFIPRDMDTTNNLSQEGQPKRIRYYRSVMISQLCEIELPMGDANTILDGADIENCVLCVVISDYDEQEDSKTLKCFDATGLCDFRVFRKTNTEAVYDVVNDGLLGRYVIITGRINQSNKLFNVTNINADIPPYQFMYHEIQATREYYNFTGVLSINADLLNTNPNEPPLSEQTDDVKSEMKSDSKELFVDQNDNIDPDLVNRVKDMIRGIEEQGEGARLEWIANEMIMDAEVISKVLDKLVTTGTIYDVDGVYHLADDDQ